MSRARHACLIGLAAILMLSLSGCVLKKKQASVPPQAQAPTTTTTETPAPATTTEPQAAPEQKPAETQSEAKSDEKPQPVEEKQKQPKKKPAQSKKPAPPAQTPLSTTTQASVTPPPVPAPAKPNKVIIQEGSAPSTQGQLAAGVSLEDPSSRNKQTTEQLLHATQTNLNSINRPLSPDEQAIVAQIKDYMKQSVQATNNSDPVRAHNLALKAHLLSEELVKK